MKPKPAGQHQREQPFLGNKNELMKTLRAITSINEISTQRVLPRYHQRLKKFTSKRSETTARAVIRKNAISRARCETQVSPTQPISATANSIKARKSFNSTA